MDAIAYTFCVGSETEPVTMKLWDDSTARITAERANKLGADVRVVYRPSIAGGRVRVWDNGEDDAATGRSGRGSVDVVGDTTGGFDLSEA